MHVEYNKSAIARESDRCCARRLICCESRHFHDIVIIVRAIGIAEEHLLARMIAAALEDLIIASLDIYSTCRLLGDCSSEREKRSY